MSHKSYGRDSGGCGTSLLIAGQKSMTNIVQLGQNRRIVDM